jgi:hypothetical protein
MKCVFLVFIKFFSIKRVKMLSILVYPEPDLDPVPNQSKGPDLTGSGSATLGTGLEKFAWYYTL